MTQYIFPQDFLWGAATASYQIEGAVFEDGRGTTVWDVFADTPGKVKNGDSGEVACDHYHRYPQDVALMKQLGLHAYRFSIAWARILPEGTGNINPAGLDFYDKLLDTLLVNGIRPFATLYHWDLPQALEDKGGWTNKMIVDWFGEYVHIVTKRLGDRLKDWMTLNEPWVFTYLGYASGDHAPGHRDLNMYIRASHHSIMAHARAVNIVHANVADSQVGIVLNPAWSDPHSDTLQDYLASQRLLSFQNRWWLHPLYHGEYPADMMAIYGDKMAFLQADDFDELKANPSDFLGVNFYTRHVVQAMPYSDEWLKFITVRQNREHTEMDWEVSPEAIYNVLKHIHDEYAPSKIYITENGAAFNDVVTGDSVHDERRVAFYQQYLAHCHRAIADGIPLKGYFAWSLLDNFEWAEGYSKRFGIIYVDYPTQRRIIKDSGKWYAQTIRDNGFVLP
ncbi:MAG: beta-glucosidase [Phototrophicales bacterium]|nr:MAG: beta-glucosidase [Phototrophicales bacterium]